VRKAAPTANTNVHFLPLPAPHVTNTFDNSTGPTGDKRRRTKRALRQQPMPSKTIHPSKLQHQQNDANKRNNRCTSNPSNCAQQSTPTHDSTARHQSQFQNKADQTHRCSNCQSPILHCQSQIPNVTLLYMATPLTLIQANWPSSWNSANPVTAPSGINPTQRQPFYCGFLANFLWDCSSKLMHVQVEVVQIVLCIDQQVFNCTVQPVIVHDENFKRQGSFSKRQPELLLDSSQCPKIINEGRSSSKGMLPVRRFKYKPK
jgi:hypothetical protein